MTRFWCVMTSFVNIVDFEQWLEKLEKICLQNNNLFRVLNK